MLLAGVFGWTFFIVGLVLAFQGLWTFSRAMWPNRVQAAAARCQRNSAASFLLGLLVSFFVVFASSMALKLGGTPGQILGFFLLAMWFLYANVGLAGLATHLGERLSSPADADRPWRATIRGGIALELAWLFPVAGWVGLLPISLIVGVGAATLSFFRPRIDCSGTASSGSLPTTPNTASYLPQDGPDSHSTIHHVPVAHTRTAVAEPAELLGAPQ